jgi:hypothetical protein
MPTLAAALVAARSDVFMGADITVVSRPKSMYDRTRTAPSLCWRRFWPGTGSADGHYRQVRRRRLSLQGRLPL